MRGLLLYNPNATTTNARVRDAVTTALAEHVDLQVAPTKQRGHAAHLAAGAVHEGVDVVFALGGDGTANEVVQGLATTDVAFAHLPGGGTNVLARALGLPNDPVAAAEQVCRAALEDRARTIGLGMAGDRWFTFIAGLGFDAAIVRRVEQHPRLKRVARQLSFVWCGLQEWFEDGAGLDPTVTVTLPDGRIRGPRSIAIVGNTDPYTYLGPRALHITPQASFDAGLDLVTVGPVSTPRILAILARAFGSGSHVRDPNVDEDHDLDHFVLASDRPLPLMVDGDYAGDWTRVTFRAVPDALRVLA